MKVGVAVAPTDALPSAFVVWRGLAESMEKAAQYGFDGVELALRSGNQAPAAEIIRSCPLHGLEMCAISTGQVFGLDFTNTLAQGAHILSQIALVTLIVSRKLRICQMACIKKGK